jgi:hypothetical protein
MRLGLSVLLLPFASMMFQASTRAQDVVVPAGTLLHCTIDDPNLSSATASVGDPVICHLRSLQEFGHVVFPRGSYLGGHIESYKEPGHFFGKGNLKLSFDRIGLPSTDIPVPSKITSASGYRVDRKGEIIGHGHAKRDTVEWLLPPIWPWKVITLPARGPRPTLKGETQITLRLMDDLVVPRTLAAAGYPGEHPSFDPLETHSQPASFATSSPSTSQFPRIGKISYAPPSIPAMEDQSNLATTDPVQTASPELRPAKATSPVRLSFIALKSGEIYTVAHYRIDEGSLSYELPSGEKGSIDLPEVDWQATAQLNAGVPASSVSVMQQQR